MVQENSVSAPDNKAKFPRKKPKIVVIGGPTGVGKSDLAVEAAVRFGGEIVGADSMQIYRGMDIGTGKVTAAEMRGVPHHLIDFLSPDADYSVGKYASDAERTIDEILGRGRLPIVAGGTGLYINAIIGGLDFPSAANNKTRSAWKKVVEEEGPEPAYEYLRSVDPISAANIAKNDSKRIIRAIEIFEATGRPKSEASGLRESKYDYIFFVLTEQRETLYAKINARVDRMFEAGLWEEARALERYRDRNSMQAIGYKQILAADADTEELRDRIKQLSRNYAKRQMTYFRGMRAEKIFVSAGETETIYDKIREFLNND